MITAAYTICKNEVKYIEKWMYYTKDFDYRVILDTGSTDGTYEELIRLASTDKNLIIEQKSFIPWKFDVARNYNLGMVPLHVDWCLSPDMDEFFSINVLDEMQKTISQHRTVTNIACDRLDIYSSRVRVGPPDLLSTNKIHRRNDYIWTQPIYEHLWFKHKDRKEVEIYNKDIYLIHDQDFRKKERSDLYLSMLLDEYNTNPTNCWTLWYLVNHYYKVMDLDKFIECGIVFVENSHRDERYFQVKSSLEYIFNNVAEATDTHRDLIRKALSL